MLIFTSTPSCISTAAAPPPSMTEDSRYIVNAHLTCLSHCSCPVASTEAPSIPASVPLPLVKMVVNRSSCIYTASPNLKPGILRRSVCYDLTPIQMHQPFLFRTTITHFRYCTRSRSSSGGDLCCRASPIPPQTPFRSHYCHYHRHPDWKLQEQLYYPSSGSPCP